MERIRCTEEKQNLNKRIIDNIISYIENEGLRKSRLAKRMQMPLQNFDDYLNHRNKNIVNFSVELAGVLGKDSHFFMHKHFQTKEKSTPIRMIDFPAETSLRSKGNKDFDQLLRVCHLIDVYHTEESKPRT